MSKLNSTDGRTDSGKQLAVRAALALAASLAVGDLVQGAAPPAASGRQIQVEKVVSGSAQFQFNGSSTLVRTGTDKTIINYRQFNVLSGQSVNFAQPSAASRVLNRINAGDPSRLDGSIRSNGILYFVNPAGIIFGPNSVVNVGQIYAAAGTIKDADFLAGRNQFTNLRGPVINGGLIQAGGVHLAGQRVVNLGTIIGANGAVTMSAGKDVLIGQERDGRDTGHLFVKIEGAAAAVQAAASKPEPAVQNAGSIVAPVVRLGAGDLFSIAVRASGSIKGQDVAVQGGKGSTVSVAGKIDATNANGKGGVVKVLGEKVALLGAKIDASGATGGGTVLVGGDFRGKGTTPTASATAVDAASGIKSDAVSSGDGGKVVVWSDGATQFAGSISARGGSSGGNGGSVEVSGKQELAFTGRVDTRAPMGAAGMLLLDPNQTIIDNTDSGGEPTHIAAATLVTQLDTTPVTVSAAVDISVLNAVDASGNAGSFNLTLDAPTVNLSAPITLKGAALLLGGATTTTVNVSGTGKIQNGIDIVVAGAANTVNVAAGTFTESLSIAKALTLKGANFGVDGHAARGAESIITSAGPVVTLVDVAADDVTVDGFAIQGNSGGAGVTLSPAFSGYQLKNNIIANNAFGLNLGSSGVNLTTVSHNWLDSNNQAGGGGGIGDAIYTDVGVTKVLIDSNTFTGHSSASMVFAGLPGQQDQITVSNNTFTGDNSAVFVNTTNLTINNNVFDTTQGSAIYLGGNDSTVSIHDNDIKNGVSNGIKVVDGEFGTYGPNSGITVANNYIDGNDIGIYIGGGVTPGLVGIGVMTVNNNHIAGNATAGIQNNSLVTVNATNNWWGSANGPSNAANTFNVASQGDVVGGPVTFVTWLNAGTSSSASPSFTPTGIAFAPVTLGAGNFSNIQDAIDAGISGDTINLAGGTYTEVFSNAGKNITLAFGGSGGLSDASGLTLGADLSLTGTGTTALTLAQAVDASGFQFAVDTSGGSGAVNINSIITYTNQPLSIKAGGLLSFGATGGIAGGGSGDATLAGVGVTQNVLADIAAGSGKISIDGGAGVVTTGPLTTTSVDVAAIKIFNASDVHVNGAMSALNGTAALTVGAGALDQTAKIEADILSIAAGGTITLNHAGNAVNTLTITSAGGTVQFKNAASLMLGGIAANNLDVTLTAVGANRTLGQSGIIDTGANKLTLDAWGDTTLNSANTVSILSVTNGAGFVKVTDAANLDVQGISAATKVVTLTASGAGQSLSETAGIINAGELDLASWDTTALNQANTVGILKVSGATGSVGFTNAVNLDVRGLSATGQPVTLTASGATRTLGQSVGIIDAAELDLDSWGTTTLNAANTVSVLKVASAAGDVQFTSAGSLDVQQVDAVGHSVTVASGGVLTISQPAVAGALVAGGTGGISLNAAGTDLTPTVKTAGTQTYNNAVTLLADTVLTGSTITLNDNVTGAFALKFNGAVSVNADLTISTSSLTLAGAVDDSVDATHVLTLGVTGLLSVGGDIGAAHPLKGLAINGSGTMSVGKTGGLAIRTDGNTQTYNLPITLSSDTTFAEAGSGDVIFNSTIDGDTLGAWVLTVNTVGGGTTHFGAAIGAAGLGTELGAVITDAFGATQLDGGAIKVVAGGSSSGITFGDPVTLGASAVLTNGGGAAWFKSTVDGTLSSETLTITGDAQFDDVVGSVELAALSVGGTTLINTPTINTTNASGGSGDQTYTGAVTISAGNALVLTNTGGLAWFKSTVNGTAGATAESLGISDNAQFDGTVGGSKALESLVVGGATAINTPTINTSNVNGGSGDQTYIGAVTIGAGNALVLTNTGGLAWFKSTVDGTVGATLETLSIGNDARFDGVVGGNKALGSLDVGGTTLANTTAINTDNVNGGSGDQTYTGAVTIGAGNALVLTNTGGLAWFKSTLDGTVGATVEQLTVSNDAHFGGIVGGTKALGSLLVSGLSQIDADVTTSNANGGTGSQTYSGAVTIGAGSNVTLTAPGSQLSFGSTVDGMAGATVETLAITNNATFDFAVGGSKPLGSLSVGGATAINTPTINTSNLNGGTGDQTYTGAVTIGAGNALMLTNTGGLAWFKSTVDGTVGATLETLSISDNARFDGIVGGNKALGSLDVGGTTLANTTAINTDNVNGGSGDQTYTGAFTIGSGNTLALTNTGGLAWFKSTLDGTLGATVEQLTVSDDAHFGGIVGGTKALGSLLVSGLSQIDADVTTSNANGGTGSQTYGGAVTLDTTTNLTGSTVSFLGTVDGGDNGLTVTGNAVFGNAATDTVTGLSSLQVLGTSAINTDTVSSSGTQTYGGAVTLGTSTTLTGSTVSFLDTVAGGANGLTVTGNAVFGNAATDTVTGLSTLQVTGTSAINTDTVSSSGTQTYDGAVTLGTSTTLTGSTVSFLDTVAGGANGLTVTGNAVFGNAATDTVTGLSTLQVTGTSAINTDTVSSSGTQTYDGAVTLGTTTNLTGSTVSFLDTVAGGANGLTVTGNAVFGNAATDTVTGLSTLQVTGTSAINTDTVSSSGTQTYDGAVTLGTSTTLTGSTVSFLDTVAGGANGLTVTGNAVFGNAATDTVTGLSTLQVTGTSAINTDTVSSSGTQTYDGAVTLGTTTNLTGSTVSFLGTVDGGDNGLTVTGNAVFGNAATDTVTGLSTLQVTGTSAINTDTVSSSVTQTYEGAVTLGTSMTLTGSTVSFLDTVAGATNGLTVTGNAVFGNAATDTVTGLSTLQVTGTSAINTDTVSSSGTQTYDGAVTLGTSTTLTGSTVSFLDTVAGGANGLTVTGNAVFGNAATDTVTGLSSLQVLGTSAINTDTVSSSGTQTYGGAVTLGTSTTLTGSTVSFLDTVAGGANGLTVTGNAVFGNAATDTVTGLSTLQVTGTSAINTDTVSSSGTQTYDGAVTLGTSTTLTGSTVSFLDTVAGGTNGLTVTGNAVFGNAATDTVTGLSTLQVTGTSAINTDTVSSSGTQTYDGAVTLGTTTNLTGSTVSFLDTVAGGANALTVTGNAIFGNAATDTVTGLSTLHVTGMSVIRTDAVSSSGTQTYDGAVTLGTTTNLTGSTVSFLDTVAGGANGLTVTGNAVFGNAATDTVTGLSTLQVTGTSAINTDTVSSSVTQTYEGAVTLGTSMTLTGSTVSFLDTVAGATNGLTVTGNAVFGNAATDTVTGLSTLQVTGTSAINTDTVSSSGTQTYDGAVTLGTSTTLTGSTVSFLDTVAGGANGLTVTGNAVFGNAATDTVTGLSTLHVTGASVINAAAVTSTDTQTYDGPVTVGTNTALTSGGNISFGSTVDGSSALAVVASGDVDFSGLVGNATPLGSLNARAGRNLTARQITASGDLLLQAAPGVTGSNGDFRPAGLLMLYGSLTSTSGDVQLNAAGRASIPSVATIVVQPAAAGTPLLIVAGNDVVMGQNEKMTVRTINGSSSFGDLRLAAGHAATVSDIVTAGDLTLSAPSLTVRDRIVDNRIVRKGKQLVSTNGVLILAPDFGTNIVAGGSIVFDLGVPGSGTANYADSDGVVNGITVAGAAYLVNQADLTSQLLVTNPVLSFIASGIPNLDIANTIAGAVPRAMPRPEQDSGLSGALKNELRSMGVSARDWDVADLINSLEAPPKVIVEQRQLISGPDDRVDVTADRLSREAARAAAAAFFDAYYEESADSAKGTDREDPRTGRMKHVVYVRSQILADLTKAVKAYMETAEFKKTQKFNVLEFQAFVNSSPEQAAARDRLTKLRVVFKKVGELGLTRRELAQAHQALLSGIVPEGMDSDQMLELLTGPMTTVSR